MILISVAHNSIDRGAHNEKFNVSEYELSQKMSYACLDALRNNGIGAMVFDVGPVNPHKGKKIRTVDLHEPQLALEIHLNSAPKPGNYSSVFYKSGSEQTQKLSLELSSMLGKLTKTTKPKCIGIPEPGYDTERYWFITKTCVPAIIIEPLFINNDKHMEFLLEAGNLEAVGREIGKEIALWAGLKKE